MHKKNMIMIMVITLIILSQTSVFANKSKVTIEAPDNAAIGETIKIRLHVQHIGNNFFHFTKTVVLYVNGSPYKTWKYGWNKRPDIENFVVETEYVVKGKTDLAAQADCNLHGSANYAVHKIAIK